MGVSISVPNTFATQSGNVPASELDANFTALVDAFALFLSADGTQGPTAPLSYTQSLSLAPTGGIALTVTGASTNTAIVVNSGNSSTTSNGDVIVTRAGSTANQPTQGANFEMVDSVTLGGANWQWSGNQLEAWHGISADSPVHWQLGFWDANATFHLPGPRPAASTALSIVTNGVGTADSGNGITVTGPDTVSTVAEIKVTMSSVDSIAIGVEQSTASPYIAVGSQLQLRTGGFTSASNRIVVGSAGNITLSAPSSGNTLNIAVASGGTGIVVTPATSTPALAVLNGAGSGVPWLSLGSQYAITGSQTATFTATNKPGSGTTAPSLWEVKAVNGVVYYSPLWQ
jgi:hypothetical protein